MSRPALREKHANITPSLNMCISLFALPCGEEVIITKSELTLYRPGLVGAQHNVDHEGELRSALTESLDESEHAEVMCKVHSVL